MVLCPISGWFYTQDKKALSGVEFGAVFGNLAQQLALAHGHLGHAKVREAFGTCIAGCICPVGRPLFVGTRSLQATQGRRPVCAGIADLGEENRFGFG